MSEAAVQLVVAIAWLALAAFLATVVWRRGQKTALRTWLLLFLGTETAMAAFFAILLFLGMAGLGGQTPIGRAAAIGMLIGVTNLAPLYVLFVGRALPSALTRWATSSAAVVGVASYAAVMTTWLILATSGFDVSYGSIALPMRLLALVLSGLFGLVAAIICARGAPVGSQTRRTAFSFLLAFGWRDLFLVTTYALRLVVDVSPQLNREDLSAAWTWIGWSNWSLLLRDMGFLVLLTYGLLAGQVLDLDRRFQWTISKATVAAIFIGVFVAVQTFVSESLTSGAGLVAGSAAAGILVFAMAPLQKIADRVGRVAVQAPAEDESFYEEQVRIAYSDGHIGAKERALLGSIRKRIGLSAENALSIEERVAAGAGPA